MVLTAVALEPPVHRRLLLASVKENASMQVLMQDALTEWLDRRKTRSWADPSARMSRRGRLVNPERWKVRG